MEELSIYGKKQRIETKNRIKEILVALKSVKSWRDRFYEKFPSLNCGEVERMITKGYQGRCDDLVLLKALEEFKEGLNK